MSLDKKWKEEAVSKILANSNYLGYTSPFKDMLECWSSSETEGFMPDWVFEKHGELLHSVRVWLTASKYSQRAQKAAYVYMNERTNELIEMELINHVEDKTSFQLLAAALAIETEELIDAVIENNTLKIDAIAIDTRYKKLEQCFFALQINESPAKIKNFFLWILYSGNLDPQPESKPTPLIVSFLLVHAMGYKVVANELSLL